MCKVSKRKERKTKCLASQDRSELHTHAVPPHSLSPIKDVRYALLAGCPLVLLSPQQVHASKQNDTLRKALTSGRAANRCIKDIAVYMSVKCQRRVLRYALLQRNNLLNEEVMASEVGLDVGGMCCRSRFRNKF